VPQVTAIAVSIVYALVDGVFANVEEPLLARDDARPSDDTAIVQFGCGLFQLTTPRVCRPGLKFAGRKISSLTR
jgi:hypothetical protein